MTRNDIIRLAREVWSAGDAYIGPSTESLQRFAALVAAAEREKEREACLKLATEPGRNKAGVAAAIRARGQ